MFGVWTTVSTGSTPVESSDEEAMFAGLLGVMPSSRCKLKMTRSSSLSPSTKSDNECTTSTIQSNSISPNGSFVTSNGSPDESLPTPQTAPPSLTIVVTSEMTPVAPRPSPAQSGDETTERPVNTTGESVTMATTSMTSAKEMRKKSRTKIDSKRSDLKPSSDRELTKSFNKSQKRKQAQNEAFGRQFSDVKEPLINSYHCALVQDILMQGVLYVTQNWFCFYSKLFGKKPPIKILVTDVTNISKLKTAGIIPNAVGIETKTDKFTFVSLMARGNTYRLMWDIWKTAQCAVDDHRDDGDSDQHRLGGSSSGGGGASDVVDGGDGVHQLLAAPSRLDPADSCPTTDNDSSSIGSTDPESIGLRASAFSDVFYAESPTTPASTLERRPPSAAETSLVGGGVTSQDAVAAMTSPPTRVHKDCSEKATVSGSGGECLRRRGGSTDDARTSDAAAVQQSSRKINNNNNIRPACVLLLVISAALLLVLTTATVILVYKLIRLQSLVEIGLPPTSFDSDSATPESAHWRSSQQTIDIRQLQEILDSHKQLLEHVNRSITGLSDLTRGVCASLLRPGAAEPTT